MTSPRSRTARRMLRLVTSWQGILTANTFKTPTIAFPVSVLIVRLLQIVRQGRNGQRCCSVVHGRRACLSRAWRARAALADGFSTVRCPTCAARAGLQRLISVITVCSESCCDSEAEKKALDVAVDSVVGAAGMIGCKVGLNQCGMAAKNETNAGCTAALGTFKDCSLKAELQDKTNASQVCDYMKKIYKCYPSEYPVLSGVCPPALYCRYSDVAH
jgi:hypothetical protein